LSLFKALRNSGFISSRIRKLNLRKRVTTFSLIFWKRGEISVSTNRCSFANSFTTMSNHTSSKISRRTFGKKTASAASAAFAFQFIPSRAWGNLTKPTMVGIGSGGKGRSDIANSELAGFDIVGLVDVVDVKKFGANKKNNRRENVLIESREAYPDVPFWTDYREMFADMGDKVDAVTVSTPDHHHFHASVMAMQAGKHVYCQKPLTHGIWEARMMSEVASQTGVKTQMGNQAHAEDHMRRCVELIRSGIIGKVRDVHTWTNRPIWPQGFANPPQKQKVPKWIDWKQWVGPAGHVDYNENIAPFSWRGWWEYGTGALGDMACHIMDMPYWALMPGAPKNVKAEQAGATEFSPPINSKIVWEFGPSEHTHSRGVRFNWYDGYVDAHFDPEIWALIKESEEYNHPSPSILDGRPFNEYGCVVVGEEGKMFFHRQNNNWVVNPTSIVDGYSWPAQSLPRARGDDKYKNHNEWFDTIAGKLVKGQSNFELAGPFTEMILLGVLAQRVPNENLEWDHKNMEIVGRPELKKYIQRDYTKDWEAEVSGAGKISFAAL